MSLKVTWDYTTPDGLRFQGMTIPYHPWLAKEMCKIANQYYGKGTHWYTTVDLDYDHEKSQRKEDK